MEAIAALWATPNVKVEQYGHTYKDTARALCNNTIFFPFCAPQEALKKELETEVDKLFTRWEKSVVQTPSNGGKTFSYMVTQSVSRRELQTQ